jgi:hypothetical protein
LGLQVTDVTGVDSDLHSTVKPVYPFWMNVDLVYGLGKNLYWRGRNTRWSSTDDPGPETDPGPNNYKGTRYITFGGGALQEAATLFVAPNSNIQVLPLPIEPTHGATALEDLVYNYLRTDSRVFHLFSKRYVYMIVRRMINTSAGIGATASEEEEQIEFVVPIVWYDIDPNKPDPTKFENLCLPDFANLVQGVAFMRLFVLSDSQLTTITESEVFGLPTVLSVITGSESPWTAVAAPAAEMTMITASTHLLPGLNSGQAPDLRTLVRVEALVGGSLPIYQPGKPWGTPEDRKIWDTVSSSFKNLVEQIIPSVSLKQVVDCREPDRADYQAIVLRGVRTDNSTGYTPSPHRLQVKIHSYDSVPLVKKMGLKVSFTELDPDNQTDVQVIDAVHPFSFSSEMRADIAVNLDWRHGDGPWKKTATDEALIAIEFSAAKDAMPASPSKKTTRTPTAHPMGVSDDVNRAIGNVCLMEKALDQWNTVHPPPKEDADKEAVAAKRANRTKRAKARN